MKDVFLKIRVSKEDMEVFKETAGRQDLSKWVRGTLRAACGSRAEIIKPKVPRDPNVVYGVQEEEIYDY